jgi:hypothetical protein
MTLHVTNGDSTAATLRETSLGGDVLAWRDALHDGPLGGREERARFLSDCGFARYDEVLADLERRDRVLADALGEDIHVVLWFEHDLYDQLQLLQILDRVASTDNVELINVDSYLGTLAPEELEALWPIRRPVTDEQVGLARRAWAAVRMGELEPLLADDLAPFPFLKAALERLRDDRPASGLPRSDRQLLELLVERPRTRPELFRANQDLEEAQFAGDVWVWRRLDLLAGREPPLVEEQGGLVELTAAGRDALVAEAAG